jgi:hypothetical protein
VAGSGADSCGQAREGRPQVPHAQRLARAISHSQKAPCRFQHGRRRGADQQCSVEEGVPNAHVADFADENIHALPVRVDANATDATGLRAAIRLARELNFVQIEEGQ